MSARLYPPRMGVIQTTGIGVRYPSPWAGVSIEICKNWKLVIQEIEQPRLKQALKAKEMMQYVYCWGVVLGSGQMGD